MTEHRENLARQLLRIENQSTGGSHAEPRPHHYIMANFIIAREREAELRGWERAIEFFEELDVPSDHREYAATLKALRVELSRRRAETGA